MLKPLQQWYCDTCGKLIEKPEDGYVQFKEELIDGTYIHTDFIIVHHKTASPIKTQKGCYRYNCDDSLKDFLGDRGKVQLLNLLDVGKYHMPEFKLLTNNIRTWRDFFMRLQVPYYEEARRYIDRARVDGVVGYDENELGLYLPERLKKIVEHYDNKIEF
jgi:hypothetical protein